MALLCVACAVVVFASLRGLDGSASRVNRAGRQRMLAQRVAALTLAIRGPGAVAARRELNQTLDRLEASQGLLLKEPMPEAARSRLEDVAPAYRALARDARNPDAVPALAYDQRVLDESASFVRRMDLVVEALTANDAGRVRQAGALALGLACVCALTLAGLHRWVFRPLAQRLQTAEETVAAQVAILEGKNQALAASDARRLTAENRLRHIIDHLPAGAMTIEGETVHVNRYVEALTGFAAPEIATLDAWFRAVYRDGADEVRAYYEAVRAEGFHESHVVPITRKDGEVRWIEFAAVRTDCDEVWVLYDVTAHHQAQEAVRNAHDDLLRAEMLAGLGSWTREKETGRFTCTEGLYRLLGFSPEDAPATVEEFLPRIHPEDRDRVYECFRRATTEEIPYDIEYRLLLPGAQVRYVRSACRWIPSRGVLAGTLLDMTKAREQERLIEAQLTMIGETAAVLQAQKAELLTVNAQLERIATLDGLTGLLNRRAFDDRLQMEFEYAQRYGTDLSLVLLDIDHFKRLNDDFGHQVGDSVLRRVAGLLTGSAHTGDFVARYGGEEIAILLRNCDREAAWVTAERFREAIESAHWPNRPVTASFGVATLGACDVSSVELIAEADRALYRSKALGRNRVVHASECAVFKEARVAVQEERLS